MELMVALAISVVLLAGLVSLFTQTSRSYRFQEGLNNLNDRAQYVMNLLRRELSMAGHWGGATPGATQLAGTPPGAFAAGNCLTLTDNDLDFTTMQLVAGYISFNALNNLPGGAFDINCNGARRFVENTDLFVVRYLRAENVMPTDMEQAYGKASVKGPARIFWGPAGLNTAVLDNAQLCTLAECTATTPEGSATYPYHEAVYFVRPCAEPPDPAGGRPVACTDTDVPTLARFVLEGETYSEQGLAAGVERMQLYFGVDTDENNVVDVFTSFPIPGTTEANRGRVSDTNFIEDWEKVQQVQVELLFRPSYEIDRSGGTTDTTYAFRDQSSSESTTLPRRMLSVTVQLRNHNFVPGLE